MQIKQSPQEAQQAMKELLARLKPYRLVCFEPRDSNERITANKDIATLDEYMLKTFTGADGKTDYSAANMYLAISRLRDRLTWREGFGPKKPTNDPIARRSHTDAFGVVDAAQRERERTLNQQKSERNAKMLNACADLVTHSFCPGPHSVKGRRRQELKAKFDQLVAAKTRPENIYELLQAQIRSWN